MMRGWTEIKDAAQVEARSPHWMPAFDAETSGCSRVGLAAGNNGLKGFPTAKGMRFLLSWLKQDRLFEFFLCRFGVFVYQLVAELDDRHFDAFPVREPG